MKRAGRLKPFATRVCAAFRILCPGLIAGAADDDPSGIGFNPECGNFLVASVERLDSSTKDLWAINSEISCTVVDNPCPSATLTVKMKGYGGKRRHIIGAGMNCIKNICSGQYWPGSEIDIGAWVDGNEATATWVGCDTVIGKDCHIAMDSKEPIDSKQIPILMPWELIKNPTH